VDTTVENREHHLVKRGRALGGHRIVSTVCSNPDEGQSAPTANGTEYELMRLWWKVGYNGFLGGVFHCILVALSFLIPFLLLCSFTGWGLQSEHNLHDTDNG